MDTLQLIFFNHIVY